MCFNGNYGFIFTDNYFLPKFHHSVSVTEKIMIVLTMDNTTGYYGIMLRDKSIIQLWQAKVELYHLYIIFR